MVNKLVYKADYQDVSLEFVPKNSYVIDIIYRNMKRKI